MENRGALGSLGEIRGELGRYREIRIPVFTDSLRRRVGLLHHLYAVASKMIGEGKVIMDALYIGTGAVFFAIAWGLVWAFGHLRGERQL